MLYDLHIHSCLSPCGDNDMTPNNIAGMAYLAGLGVIALTDHNTARNVPALAECCRERGIMFIPGIEVSSSEDFHIVCYFRTVEAAVSFGDMILDHMPDVGNRPEIFGEEIIMDADDNPIGNVDKYLLNAGGLSARQVVEECHKYGGRAVYAHIDNTSFSVLSVLGTIPEDIPIDGVELHDLSKRHDLVKAGLLDEDMPYMSDSDAHYLENIGDRGCTLLPGHPLYDWIKE